MASNFNGSSGSNKNTILLIVSGVIMAIVVIALLTMSSSFKKNQLLEDYQAVFLTNGQVYFGHLDMTMEYYELTDIYYLQVNQNLQLEEDNKPDLSLIKLGEELHGPTDRMLINREQVLFIEDIAKDSKVIKAIAENKKE